MPAEVAWFSLGTGDATYHFLYGPAGSVQGEVWEDLPSFNDYVQSMSGWHPQPVDFATHRAVTGAAFESSTCGLDQLPPIFQRDASGVLHVTFTILDPGGACTGQCDLAQGLVGGLAVDRDEGLPEVCVRLVATCDDPA